MIQVERPSIDAASPFGRAVARVEAGADARAEADALVTQMTTDEKLGCLDGDLPYWPGVMDLMAGGYHRHTFPAAVVERLGIPGLHFADGPRGCVVGPCTAFTVSMARGASFDPDLERRVGEAIGAELRAQGATYNRCGLHEPAPPPGVGAGQETYGEDPHHVGEMAAAFTVGLQRHVMACMKHFALNNMENARFRSTSPPTSGCSRGLPAALPAGAEAGVASVMSAYNSVNGEWCGQNEALLVDVLRDEWGWDGFVITDFIMGLRDPVGSVGAGCNVEMPFRQQRVTALADALDDGSLALPMSTPE